VPSWRSPGARWSAYPGIGRPGVERIDLFTGARSVLTLDANALRVLVRLGYGDPTLAYADVYQQAQAATSAETPETVPARQRAHQLLRRHRQTTCRRRAPHCRECPLVTDCRTVGRAEPLF
jgi:endonuclease III